MDKLFQDIRYSVRMLMKRPGFTVIAVLTLALGIGANTAIFSVINTVLLRALPYPDAERIVQIWETYWPEDMDDVSISPRNFEDWQKMNQSFERMAAYRYGSFALTGGDQPEQLRGASVMAGFLSVVGVAPSMGRDFLAEEDKPGQNRAVILSHGLWQRRFGSDTELVGRTIPINSESYTVVGVMPPGFNFPGAVELWVPIGLDFERIGRGSRFLQAVGRLKPGVSINQAQAEMDTIAGNLQQQYPDNNTDLGVRLVPLQDQLVGDMKLRLWILLGAVALVLLIACANVANLQLARAIARQKETAIRTALGAGRRHLIRQFLTENLLLAIVGGGIGVLLAMWGVDLLASVAEGQIHRVSEVAIDGRVLGFSAAISLMTGIIFGLAPALQASRINLNESLKESYRGASAGWRSQGLRSLLVVSEIALALVLLIGAGLLINSFFRLQGVNPGFEPENVLTMTISLPQAKYGKPHQQGEFFQQTLERISAIDGARAAGAISELPFSGSRSRSSLDIEGYVPSSDRDNPVADYRSVSPGYFKAMGIPLLRGRDFSDRDVQESPLVAIINQTMANRYWPDQDPIGKRLRMGSPQEIAIYGEPVWREIVGVIGDVKHMQLTNPEETEMYFSYHQMPTLSMSLVVKGTGDAQKLIGSIRGAVQSIDPDQPVSRFMTMQERLDRSISTERLNTSMLAVFASLALILAVVGVYGVMSYAVSQSTREIGIRMALGAQARDVLRLVVGRGLMLTLAGVGLGLAGAYGLTRLMSSLLYGVTATDPLTFAGLSLLLIAVGILACYLPARRAAKVDPMEALRYE